jgi:NADH:ubiquinone oxidoreductase subunit 2 (subunit N)
MLTLGLFALYLLFIIGGNKNIKRILQLILINYLIFLIYILNISTTIQIDLILFDGLIQIKEILIISEIILSILILIILQYCTYDKLLIIYLNILGIIFLFESNDFIITFLSLELYNITIYLLIGNSSSGLKYFILSCIFSTIFFLGLILIYNNFGLTNLQMIHILQYYDSLQSNIFIFLAILFKLGLFPFHQWLPDLYDNISSSYVIWLQIISKYALFIWLYNINLMFQSIMN